ncbi:hypothetical protein [uncultured Kriegella sp.]|uniref:hypothetical protein n=1 Tax=uncultured Kriegella sp. TaxID=1798910 RepID=UPI0030DDD06E|tara:strand:- start:31189 stop:32310 length:1122 start_codon:yes stop_codon:yes gene_type:complete
MKKILLGFAIVIGGFITIAATKNMDKDVDLTEGFSFGNPEIASINQLNFGPQGILFVGDSKKATIYALNTNDTHVKDKAAEVNIGEVDAKIAAALGTTIEKVKITDMAVNPISKVVYFGVQTEAGTPVLLKLIGENFESVPLQEISYSQIELTDPVAEDAKDHRERPLRVWAISDLKYHDGQVLVSGLSNKEFGSTFRSIPFPFNDAQDYASLEIYHAAHGKYETQSPIKTFDVVQLDGETYLMASYTCTPLVLFPMKELKNGVHSKGRTVAELGSGNSPLDMVSFEKEGKQYFVMSNTNRPIMRIDYADLAASKESLTEPIKEFAVSAGVDYVSLPMVNVLQMDNLDANSIVYMQRTADGELVLRSRTTKRM